MSEDLTIKEQLSIVVEAGLNAIPVAGGSLATLYFGQKQEKRFQRLENFYKDINEELANATPVDINDLDKDSLASIIEEINEAVESNFTESRLEFLKNCFKNSLSKQGSTEHEKKRYFISTLIKISDIELELLANLFKADVGSGYTYTSDDESINPALEKLKSLGFLNSKMNGTLKPGVNWGEITLFTISDFGREFVEYCINT